MDTGGWIQRFNRKNLRGSGRNSHSSQMWALQSLVEALKFNFMTD